MRSKKVWIGVLISAVFLYIFVRKLDWGEVWRIIKSIHYAYLPLVVLLHMAVYFFRAQRWQYLLLPLKRINLYSVFTATVIGFMANNVFPARLGEFIRAYVIGKREGVSKTASMATIVLERLFDGFSVLVFLIGLLWFFPFPPGFQTNEFINPANLKLAGYISAGVYFFILGFLWVAKTHYHTVNRFLAKTLGVRFPHLYEKVEAVLEAFVSGLEGVRKGRHLISICVYSLVVWSTIALAFYSLYPAFELQLPFSSAILLMVVIALIVAIPSSPGFVGTFHVACASSLILLGIEPNKAKSFAIILHAIVFIPVTLFGFLFVYLDKLNLKDLQSVEEGA